MRWIKKAERSWTASSHHQIAAIIAATPSEPVAIDRISQISVAELPKKLRKIQPSLNLTNCLHQCQNGFFSLDPADIAVIVEIGKYQTTKAPRTLTPRWHPKSGRDLS